MADGSIRYAAEVKRQMVELVRSGRTPAPQFVEWHTARDMFAAVPT